jgi:hypothetical protein
LQDKLSNTRGGKRVRMRQGGRMWHGKLMAGVDKSTSQMVWEDRIMWLRQIHMDRHTR